MAVALALATILVPLLGWAEPQPGDVWREYAWSGPFVNADGWQRVTDPAVGDPRARVYLPNRVNKKRLDDLDHALRAEVYVEYWGGHAGTSGKALRVNGGPWHELPRLEAIPGESARQAGYAPECYQHYSYATVAVPVAELLEGENTFEFNGGPQICHSFGWGQWGAYGVTFRIFYDPEMKPHPTGRILTPARGHTFSDSLVVEAAASSPLGDIRQVDFIGLYDDYDFEGNGIWRQWHYFYRYGQIKRHIATVKTAPYRAEWDTRWVPDQPEPISIVARIRDDTGMTTLTEPVTDVRMRRTARSVRMYKPYRVPSNWVSRMGRWRAADVFVTEDLAYATAARMALTTWSGGHADSVGVNHRRVIGRAGPAHDYGYVTPDVPLDLLQPGTNTFFTASGTEHHGIEVMWPGIVLFVEYDRPITPPVTATTDLALFDDELRTGWTTSVPADGRLVQEGSIRVGVSSSFRDFFQLHGQPISLTGYRALRLDLHPGDLRIADYHSVDLVIWDREIPLLTKGVGQRGFDVSKPEWQTIEIPLDEVYLRIPWLESIGLRGRLAGDLLIDNVRLVVDSPTAVTDSENLVPDGFSLEPAYPNPFNASVTLTFQLPREDQVQLVIYDLLGQRIRQVADAAFPAGQHTLRWSGRDDEGRAVASGMYVVRLQYGDRATTTRVLLLR